MTGQHVSLLQKIRALSAGKPFKVVLFCLMILIMTLTYWLKSDPGYQVDSESLAVSMIDAGKYGLDVSAKNFGMGLIITPKTEDQYLIYDNRALLDDGYSYEDYESQLGLQGWVLYFLAKFIPHPIAAMRLFNCFVLAVVLTLICFELNKKFGLFFSLCFYFVSLFSTWMTTFAPNLYWQEFTWFIPMLLGLVCLNNLAKRFWLYPLFFLAIAVKAACGYEFVTVVMFGSIMFLVYEWLILINKDKERQKILFRTILAIGMLCLLAFAAVFFIHAYLRGSGNLHEGFSIIYQHDIQRRTFGNASDFTYNGMLMDSLNASVFDVLAKYLWVGRTGKLALTLLVSSLFVIFYKLIKDRTVPKKEIWLFVVSFFTCISWYVLGKSHSFIHTDINIVMWYMGYMQITFYIVLSFILDRLSQINFVKTNLAKLEGKLLP